MIGATEGVTEESEENEVIEETEAIEETVAIEAIGVNEGIVKTEAQDPQDFNEGTKMAKVTDRRMREVQTRIIQDQTEEIVVIEEIVLMSQDLEGTINHRGQTKDDQTR